jgi:hypothetical protein
MEEIKEILEEALRLEGAISLMRSSSPKIVEDAQRLKKCLEKMKENHRLERNIENILEEVRWEYFTAIFKAISEADLQIGGVIKRIKRIKELEELSKQ